MSQHIEPTARVQFDAESVACLHPWATDTPDVSRCQNVVEWTGVIYVAPRTGSDINQGRGQLNIAEQKEP